MSSLLAWISQQDAEAFVIGLGVLAAAVTAVIVLVRVVLVAPLTWTIRHALDDWATERIDPRIDELHAKVDEIRTQVATNNGGSTLLDQVQAGNRAVGVHPPHHD